MKKIILTLSFLFFLVYGIQAQTEKKLNTGNVSLYLCNDYSSERGNITALFTGFNSTGRGKFKIVARIQDFQPNVVHQLQIKLIDPNKKSMFKDEKIPFTLGGNMNILNHTDNVSTTFEIEGIYQVQVWIDDKLVQYINFNVGDTKGVKNMDKGSVAMVVCNDYDSDNDNIVGIYTGLRRPKESTIKLVTRFQDFPLNLANKAVIKLITPSGKDLLDKKENTFTHGSNVHTQYHTKNMTLLFSESGVHQFQIQVNGKMVQYLNFNIGNE